MTRWAVRLGLIAGLASTMSCAASAVVAQSASSPATVPTLSGMRALLFQNKTGDWSPDVLSPEHRDLLSNSIAGPTSANATLVVIEVSGPPGGTFTGYFGRATKYSVHLVAREGTRKIILDQTQTIPVLNDQGKVSLSFLVHQTGCLPVRLTASIVGDHAPPAIQKSLNFACAE